MAGLYVISPADWNLVTRAMYSNFHPVAANIRQVHSLVAFNTILTWFKARRCDVFWSWPTANHSHRVGNPLKILMSVLVSTPHCVKSMLLVPSHMQNIPNCKTFTNLGTVPNFWKNAMVRQAVKYINIIPYVTTFMQTVSIAQAGCIKCMDGKGRSYCPMIFQWISIGTRCHFETYTTWRHTAYQCFNVPFDNEPTFISRGSIKNCSSTIQHIFIDCGSRHFFMFILFGMFNQYFSTGFKPQISFCSTQTILSAEASLIRLLDCGLSLHPDGLRAGLQYCLWCWHLFPSNSFSGHSRSWKRKWMKMIRQQA